MTKKQVELIGLIAPWNNVKEALSHKRAHLSYVKEVLGNVASKRVEKEIEALECLERIQER